MNLVSKIVLTNGTKVVIKGQIPRDANKISIVVGQDESNCPMDMMVSLDNNTVTLDSKVDGRSVDPFDWPCPYRKGDSFELTVDYDGKNYTLYMMNGKKATINNIDKGENVIVKGDLDLTMFEIK